MKRRALIAVLLALLIAIGATLSMARARQVLAEDQAHARFITAQKVEGAAMQRAISDGLLPSELAPYRSSVQRLASQQAPSALPFWSSDLTTFYNRQARGYRQLARQVKAELVLVTQRTRRQAAARIHSLTREIAKAQSLDVDSHDAQTVLEAQTRAFQQSSIPRQYRIIAVTLKAAMPGLRAAVDARQQYVSAVLAQAHDSQTEVVQQADAEAAAATHQLPLLGLLTSRAAGYRTALGQLTSAVHTQPTAFGAAVKEYELHQQVATVAADYARTVPHKMVVVSTERQWAWMYQDGKQVDNTPVTTGGPELPTDHGVFHIYMKASPWVFHSPWPPGNPYYYPPTPIQYWMPFDGGEGLHDAWWRSNFGPGSNLQPTDLGTGNYILGTHGCVNLPMAAAQFVWNWAPVGTTVVVI